MDNNLYSQPNGPTPYFQKSFVLTNGKAIVLCHSLVKTKGNDGWKKVGITIMPDQRRLGQMKKYEDKGYSNEGTINTILKDIGRIGIANFYMLHCISKRLFCVILPLVSLSKNIIINIKTHLIVEVR